MKMGTDELKSLASQLNNLAYACYLQSRDLGWWHDPQTGSYLGSDPKTVATKLLLIHSEISEATEAHRRGPFTVMDDHLPERLQMEVELADAVIRIFDVATALNFDLGNAIVEKMEYNKIRADHKIENRAKEGGKSY